MTREAEIWHDGTTSQECQQLPEAGRGREWMATPAASFQNSASKTVK